MVIHYLVCKVFRDTVEVYIGFSLLYKRPAKRMTKWYVEIGYYLLCLKLGSHKLCPCIFVRWRGGDNTYSPSSRKCSDAACSRWDIKKFSFPRSKEVDTVFKWLIWISITFDPIKGKRKGLYDEFLSLPICRSLDRKNSLLLSSKVQAIKMLRLFLWLGNFAGLHLCFFLTCRKMQMIRVY